MKSEWNICPRVVSATRIFVGFVMPIVCAALISGCGKSNVEVACPALPVVDGHVAVKTEIGGMTLNLPAYADVRQRRDEQGVCKSHFLVIEYLWYEGKLLSEAESRFKVPKGKYIPVKIFLDNGIYPDVGLLDQRERAAPNRAWKFEPALQHKKFPLELYPRFYWDDPVNPSVKSRKRASLDQIWGIRDTRFKDILNGRPFTANCNIPPADEANPDSRIESDFAAFGDSKCRGSVAVRKNGKALAVMIDVWRNGAPEINHIYDAVAEQLQTFIPE